MVYLNPLNTTSILTESQNPIRPLAINKKESGVVGSFGELLSRALGKVNHFQIRSDNMIQKMVVDPSAVDIHEVTNALSQAEMAISMTKAVSDRVINAYRDLTNIR